MNNIKQHRLWIGLILTSIITILIGACNKDFSTILSDKNYVDTATVSFGDRKVLYLIADGARGQSVKDANIPNIKLLLPHSIYSWVALSDPDSTNDATNWAAMLTGVRKEKSLVLGETFSNTNLENYPVLFKRIKAIQPSTKIVSFSSSPLFKNNLTPDLDLSENYNTDEQIKTAVVDNLTKDTASFIVGHFKDVDKAGAQYGYDNSFPEYKASIEKFDGYVGEIMDALKKRPNYSNEEWLVVIASSGGGDYTVTDNDNTIFSKPVANAFVIYNNIKYKQRIITKPYSGNRYLGKTVRFYGENVRAEIDTADIFNLDDTTKFTIELKVKKNEEKFFYPSILGKRGEWSAPHPTVGWVIYLEDRYWYFEYRGSRDANYHQVRGADLQQGRWHTLTAKSEVRSGRRYVRVYTDGLFNNEIDVTESGSFSNKNALKLGFLNGDNGSPNVYVSDIRFFKTSVPDATISKYACDTYIDESHPYYSFLVGYWPATDGQGPVLRDLGPQARDFKLKGNYVWENFNDLICPPPSTALASFVIQTTDIPVQIINWFKIPNKLSWNLDGRVWLDQ